MLPPLVRSVTYSGWNLIKPLSNFSKKHLVFPVVEKHVQLSPFLRFVYTAKHFNAVASEKGKSKNAELTCLPQSLFLPSAQVISDNDIIEEFEEIEMYRLPFKDEPYSNQPTDHVKKTHKNDKKYSKFKQSLTSKDAEFIESVESHLTLYSNKSAHYVLSSHICDQICNALGNIKDSKTAIVVGSPGPGVLSSMLLEHGASHLYLFEPHPKFSEHLLVLHANDPVTVLKENILFQMAKRKENEGHLNEILMSKYSRVVIAMVVSDKRSLQILLRNFLNECIIHDPKNVEFCFIVPKKIGQVMTSKVRVKGRHVGSYLWDFFMENELIETLPNNGLYPPYKPRTLGKEKPEIWIIRSKFRELKSNGRTVSVAEKSLLGLFIGHFISNSSHYVISSLEKWSPGIGFSLVSRGFSVFTRFADLSTEDFLELFFVFVDHTTTESPIWQVMADGHFSLKNE